MNITLSIDEKLVERARRLAAAHGTSLNQMIRRLLEEAAAASSVDHLVEELEELWAADEGDSRGQAWRRGELYDRAVLR